jgi:hypothetical protein
MLMGYGEIVSNLATPPAAQVPTTTPALMTQWNLNGPRGPGSSYGVWPDQANNAIHVTPGVYLVQFEASLIVGGAGMAGDLIFQLYKNAALADRKLTGKITATTTAAKAKCSFAGIIKVAAADCVAVALPNAPTGDTRFPQDVLEALLQVFVTSSVGGGINFQIEAATLAVMQIDQEAA